MRRKIFPALIASILITTATATNAFAAPLSINSNEYAVANSKESIDKGKTIDVSALISLFVKNNMQYYLKHFMDSDFPFFNVKNYALANPDVVAVLGNDPEVLLRHYLTYGAKEGRSCGTKTDPVVAIVTHPETMFTGSMAPEIVIATFAKVTGTTSTEGIILSISDNGTVAVREVLANAPAGAAISVSSGVTFGGQVAVNKVTGQTSHVSSSVGFSSANTSENDSSSDNIDTSDSVSSSGSGNSSNSNVEFDSWLASVPVPDNYADSAAYSGDYSTWLGIGIEKGWANKIGDDIEIPKAWFDVSEYADACAEWLNDKPVFEKYIKYDEFQVAHKNWEESFPDRNATEYIYDATGYQIACELYERVHPEPQIENYSDNEAYEIAHREWLSNYPYKVDYNSVDTVDNVDARGRKEVENLYNMLKPTYAQFGITNEEVNAYQTALETYEATKSLAIDSIEVGVYRFGGQEYDISLSPFELTEAFSCWDSDQRIKAEIQAVEFDDLLKEDKNVLWDFDTFKLVNISIRGYDTFTVAVGEYDREKVLEVGWPNDDFITPVEEVQSIYEAYQAANVPDPDWRSDKENYTNYKATETKYTFAGTETLYDTEEAAQAAIDVLAGDEPQLESSKEGACESYREAEDEWKSNKPDYSKFICDTFDDETYKEFFAEHVRYEPTIEKYTQQQAFDIDTSSWNENKPEKEDFAIDEGEDNNDNEGEASPSDEAGE
ncbi:MAG: hypothetical protein MJZ11_12200 [Lachnospiraceae bacterium]|nr:hypothetical protein [Lachnospiraceae bacterium]